MSIVLAVLSGNTADKLFSLLSLCVFSGVLNKRCLQHCALLKPSVNNRCWCCFHCELLHQSPHLLLLYGVKHMMINPLNAQLHSNIEYLKCEETLKES